MRNDQLAGQLGHAADALADAEEYIHDLEAKLKAAHEFMTGKWQPDDVDRHKFVSAVAELLNLEDDE